MRNYEFYKLDVFTNKVFSGNPLAVFPKAQGISNSEMQKIAAEMNLSETVFVLPSDQALRKLRIFTPKQELPLAGHPVVGAWNLLSRLGVVDQSADQIRIEQELNLGVLPVDLEFRLGNISKVVMTQGNFEPGETITDPDEINKLANGLGLDRNNLIPSKNLPIQVVSTGIKAVDVPVSSLNALRNCNINASVLSEIYLKHDAVGVFAFSLETLEKTSSFHARFFAPADGIPEDPATGSAAGSFAGYAIHHGIIKTKTFTIEQGDFMNRPSRIFVEVKGKKGAVETVMVGGESVIVAKGDMLLD